MEANNFLNKHQANALADKQWEVKPNGNYITFYRDDFNMRVWEEVCETLNIPISTNYVDILYFGVKTN